VIYDLVAAGATTSLAASDVISNVAIEDKTMADPVEWVVCEGVSENGDVTEAIEDAVAAAKSKLRSSLVTWRLVEMSGEYGGFVIARHLSVLINARAGQISAKSDGETNKT